MKICSYEVCTGCASCINACNNDAIFMQPNSQGFLYPIIKSDLCTNCMKCKKSCPQLNDTKSNHILNLYAALNKNDVIRESSSSGGIFAAISKVILDQHGVVFGATLDANLIVKHTYITHFNEITKLQTSKYVQSEINTSYREVKAFLELGKLVLFSGTPCQIDGLYSYLNKNYDNLYTVDILCHGVPSHKIFNDYIKYNENCYNDKISSVNFRSKQPGWTQFSMKLTTRGGKEIFSNLKCDSFMCGFLKNYFLRESCYICKYASSSRIGDITLGDYWDYTESEDKHIQNDDRGMSMIIINTKNGEKLLKKIKRSIAIEKRTLADASKGNSILYKANEKPYNYADFWNDYSVLTWEQLCDKYFNIENNFVDHMSVEDRKYFSIPFNKRHWVHVLRCYKNKILKFF